MHQQLFLIPLSRLLKGASAKGIFLTTALLLQAV
jgi:hypothetical protein